jgi:hypothetical protein
MASPCKYMYLCEKLFVYYVGDSVIVCKGDPKAEDNSLRLVGEIQREIYKWNKSKYMRHIPCRGDPKRKT